MSEYEHAVIDRRLEFATLFSDIAERNNVDIDGLLRLPEGDVQSTIDQPAPQTTPPTLIIPGLLGNSVRTLVAPLMCARERLTVKGYRTEIAWVSGRSGCAHNAKILRDTILRRAEHYGEPLNVIGYSKGCTDLLHMLGTWPETHSAVRALVSLGGVVHGTPLAKDIAGWLNNLFRYIPLAGEPVGDGLAIHDLQPRVRRTWFQTHELPDTIKYASVAALPDPDKVSRILGGSYRKLAIHNAANDSQVIDHDALIPGSELLAVVNADHWAIALPIAERHPMLGSTLVNRNDFPRQTLLQSVIDWIS